MPEIRTGSVGDRIFLDGSESEDDIDSPEDLVYEWTLITPFGSTATLTDPGAATPDFIADLPGTYIVQLVVTDSDDLSSEVSTLNLAVSPDSPATNRAPVVAILAESKVITDTDGIAGETVTFSATATDSDGTLESIVWLINARTAGTGLTPTLALPDGDNEVTLEATDNDGATSTASVLVTVEAPPLNEGWPFPYSGITPDESLGLEWNNIGALNPQDGLIYSCLRILSNDLQSTFDGIDRFDIAFQIVSLAEATIGVTRARMFNETGALNENGEIPDCSGAFEMTTGTYTDTIQAGDEVYNVRFELFDGINLLLRAVELELVAR